MEYGNYMMIVKADGDGVLDRTFSDIKSAATQGCVVRLTMVSSDVIYYGYLVTVDDTVADTYNVVFAMVSDTVSFTAETADGYPVIDS